MNSIINNAINLQKAGKIVEALQIYKKIENNADAYHLAGVCLKAQDHIEEAIIEVEKALKIKRSPIYLNTLAACFIQEQKYEKALNLLKEALNLSPEYIDALINIATTYRALDEYQLALEAAKKANKIDKTRWEPVDICASIAIDKRNYKTALALIKAIVNRPEAKKIIGKLFATAAKADQYQIIENNYEKLKNRLSWREKFTIDLSVASMESNRSNFEKARSYIDTALSDFDENIADGNINGRLNAIMTLATVESRSGNLDRAIELYDEVLNYDEKSITARWNKSLLTLAKGDLSTGWDLYETRWIWKEFPSARRKFDMPRWDGVQKGKVLVWGEQGVGDQIIFMSVVNDLLENKIDFDFEVSKKLVPVARHLFGIERVKEPGPEDCRSLPDYAKYNYQIPVGSLCGIYRAEQKHFNAKIRRIKKEEANKQKLINEFNNEFGYIPEKLIGICWRSSNMLGSRKDFYLDAHQFSEVTKSLKNLKIGFISLQYDAKQEEIQTFRDNGVDILIPKNIDQFNDILGTIKLASACDLIITAGTMVVYVGGLAGTPVLTWGYKDDFSLCGFKSFPWYPNINTIMMKRPPEKNKLISTIPSVAKKILQKIT